MKRFDMIANLMAAFLVWAVLTGIALAWLVMAAAAPGGGEGENTAVIIAGGAIVLVSAASFALYAKRRWKKLER